MRGTKPRPVGPAAALASQNVGASRHTLAMSSEIPLDLRRVALFQGGVVTRQQALGAGMSTGAIVAKIKYGRWQQIYRGVYATFTGPLNREAQLWAAVLYAGHGAELSFETAAELHGLADQPAPLVHVTIPARRRVRPPAGMVVHLSARAGRARFPRGVLPHTSVEDTILDLADAAVSLDAVCGWVTAAFGRRLAAEGPLRAMACRRKKLRWRREFGEIVAAAAGGAHSVLEYRYDRDVERAHGLPAAARQAAFTKPDGTPGFRDRHYAKYGVVVELDGRQAHPGDRRWRDIGRDNAATAAGESTLRYGWNDVTRGSCESALQVAGALRARGWTGRLKPCSPYCRATAVQARQSA